MNSVLITVVIPHMNQPEFLGKCLKSLHNQKGYEGTVEFIVVDNGSQQLPVAVCDKWPDVTLLQELAPGPGPARNLGISVARGEILSFIDADCMAHEEWLSSIDAAFANPEVEVIGGDVQVPYADSSQPTALEAYERIYAYRNKQYVATGYSGTGNLSMRADVFEKVGAFGGIELAEDRDWGMRAKGLGIRTHFVPEMIVYHPARKKFDEMQRKWDRHIAHDFSEVRGLGDKLRWILRAIAIGASPIPEIPRIVASDRVSGLRERFLAFVCLTRIRFYRFRRMLSVLAAGDGRSLSRAWNRE